MSGENEENVIAAEEAAVVANEEPGTEVEGSEESVVENPKDGEPEGQTPSEATAKDDADAKTDEPVAYDLDVPEYVQLDDEGRAKLEAQFREAGLTSEQGKQVFGLYASHVKDMQEALAGQAKSWLQETKQDSEIGGRNFAETKVAVEKAVARFGDADLRALMNDTGLGNHRAVVRFIRKVGLALSEDNSASAVEVNKGKKPSPADVFYSKVDLVAPEAPGS